MLRIPKGHYEKNRTMNQKKKQQEMKESATLIVL